MKGSQAIIIGAGIAGLAASVRLKIKGYNVLVIEANEYPGGKLSSFEQHGYRFDAGPSLFTMPEYVDDLFRIAGRKPGEHFRYIRKEESCRYFWNDGTQITAHADMGDFAAEVRQKLGIDESIVLKKLSKSRRMFELAGRIFMEKPLHKAKTWLSYDVLRAFFQLNKLGINSTMHKDNQALLIHPKLVQLFDRYATYNGSDPYRAPGVLNMIPHLEHGIGTYMPVNGMHDITTSIFNLAMELGVEFRFGERVDAIMVKDGLSTGVKTSKQHYNATVVLSNMDVTPTYRKLLPSQKAPEKILSQERSSSALIFYWGIRRSFPQLGLHNIFFSNDYAAEFRDIFAGRVPSPDPTVYVNITAKDVRSDAPEGCENWFVMVNVPGNNGQDWEKLIPQYREIVLKKLTPLLGFNPGSVIETESTLSPVDIERKTSSMGGSLYGASSNNRFAAFLRHRNESSRIKGLYFCGGSVHPGGGIPLCLLSAKIVSELIPNPS